MKKYLFLVLSGLVFSTTSLLADVTPTEYTGSWDKDFALCVANAGNKTDCIACVKAAYKHYRSGLIDAKKDCDCSTSSTVNCGSCSSQGAAVVQACYDCIADIDAQLNQLAQAFLAAITACNSLPGSGTPGTTAPPKNEAAKMGDGVTEIGSVVVVYPNPAVDNLNISFVSFDETSETTFQVINMLGEVVRTINGSFEIGMQQQTIDVNGLGSGVYFVRVSGINIDHCEKIMIAN